MPPRQTSLALFGSQTSDATFSPCRTWRYRLTRQWAAGGTPLVVIGLNPSTADESTNDPTIIRCIDFATRWGHTGLVMLNLFGFRSTDPKGLSAPGVEPVGPGNDAALLAETAGRRVLCAWGHMGALQDRAAAVQRLLAGHPSLVCLGTTRNGSPRHPLYVRADVVPTSWPPAS